MVPMDHGIPVGPIVGLSDMAETVARIKKGGADGILLHAGVAKNVDTSGLGLILHLSGATRLGGEPDRKAQVSTVRQAARLGADAVSVHINVGSEHEQEMLEMFSRVSDDCDQYGLPLLAMMYPRGPKLSNENDPDAVAHVARLSFEIGADFVMTNYTGTVESFRRVVETAKVPVLVAGGPKKDEEISILRVVNDSLRAGAAGVAIGRYVFQHIDPVAMSRAFVKVVHEGASPEYAASVFGRNGDRRGLQSQELMVK